MKFKYVTNHLVSYNGDTKTNYKKGVQRMRKIIWKKVKLNSSLAKKLKDAIEIYCDGNPNCVK